MLHGVPCDPDDHHNRSLERRWFLDEYFELILWLDQDKQVVEFQLCYDRPDNEHVMLWSAERGFSHQQVDSGEQRPGKPKATPVFIPDGVCDWEGLAERFQKASAEIDPDIAWFIYEKVLAYG